MRKKGRGLGFLLTVLVLFSAGIGLLHGRKIVSVEPRVESNSIMFSVTDALDMLRPALISEGLVTASAIVSNFSPDLIVKVIEELQRADAYSFLPADRKLAFIIGIGTVTKDSDVRNRIYSTILESFKEEPIFSTALRYAFDEAVPILKTWTAAVDKEQLARWMYISLEDAIKRDDIKLFEKLYTADIIVESLPASKLLVEVVNNKKNPVFVSLLVDDLKANPNYLADNKHTVLMCAVMNDDLAMVKALLEKGADPSIVIDSNIGNAKQLAFEKRNIAIENEIDKFLSLQKD